MAKQGALTRWEGVTELKILWEDLWKVEPVRMQFMRKSTYDLLPTPSNLVVWNKKEDAVCELCKGYASFKHILSCCKVVLTQGRYRWRHDQVLRVIAESIEKLRRGKAEGKPSKNIVFVKEGTSLPWFGVCSKALNGLTFNLSDRFQHIKNGSTNSELCELMFGVLQGSVLSTLLLSIYTSPLNKFMRRNSNIKFQLYTQLFVHMSHKNIALAF